MNPCARRNNLPCNISTHKYAKTFSRILNLSKIKKQIIPQTLLGHVCIISTNFFLHTIKKRSDESNIILYVRKQAAISCKVQIVMYATHTT